MLGEDGCVTAHEHGDLAGSSQVHAARDRRLQAPCTPGLDERAEYAGLVTPDDRELDRRMQRQRGAYRKRVLANGSVEITTNDEQGAVIVCTWVAALIAAQPRAGS